MSQVGGDVEAAISSRKNRELGAESWSLGMLEIFEGGHTACSFGRVLL